MTDIKTPDPQDARMCLDIRKRSKSGKDPSPDEIKFCREMWLKFKDWYRNTEAEVFNATVPFGSHARHPETKGS